MIKQSEEIGSLVDTLQEKVQCMVSNENTEYSVDELDSIIKNLAEYKELICKLHEYHIRYDVEDILDYVSGEYPTEQSRYIFLETKFWNEE